MLQHESFDLKCSQLRAKFSRISQKSSERRNRRPLSQYMNNNDLRIETVRSLIRSRRRDNDPTQNKSCLQLKLYDRPLKGILLEHFLVMVDLKNCFLDSLLPFVYLTRIQMLNVPGNEIDLVPEEISLLSDLRFLDLEDNRIANISGTSNLSLAKNLLYINILGNPITLNEEFDAREHLTHLCLSVIAINKIYLSDMEIYQWRIPQLPKTQHLNYIQVVHRYSNWTVSKHLFGFKFFREIYENVTKLVTLQAKLLVQTAKTMSPVCMLQRFFRNVVFLRKYSIFRPIICRVQGRVRGMLLRKRLHKELENILRQSRKTQYLLDSGVRLKVVSSDVSSEKLPYYCSIIQRSWKRYHRNCLLHANVDKIVKLFKLYYFDLKTMRSRLMKRNVQHVTIGVNEFSDVYRGLAPYNVWLKLQSDSLEEDSEDDHTGKNITLVPFEGAFKRIDAKNNQNLALFYYPKQEMAFEQCESLGFHRMLQTCDSTVHKRLRTIRIRGSASLHKLEKVRSLSMATAWFQAFQNEEINTLPETKFEFLLNIPIHCLSDGELLTLIRVIRAKNNCVVFDSLVRKTFAATTIQSNWRGYHRRVSAARWMMKVILTNRAIIVIQRWWRYRDTLYRRFQLISRMNAVIRSITDDTFYINPWLFYLFSQVKSLPAQPRRLMLLPEFRGVPLVDGSNGHCRFLVLQEDLQQVEKVSAEVAIPNDNNVATSDKVLLDDNTFEYSTFLGSNYQQRFGISSAVSIHPLVDNLAKYAISSRYEAVFPFYELVTNHASISVEEFPVSPSTCDLNVRIMKLRFKSKEEAQIRAAMLYLASYDSRLWKGVWVAGTEEVERKIHKLMEIKRPIIDAYSEAIEKNLPMTQLDKNVFVFSPQITPLEVFLHHLDAPKWIEQQVVIDIGDVMKFRHILESLQNNGRQMSPRGLIGGSLGSTMYNYMFADINSTSKLLEDSQLYGLAPPSIEDKIEFGDQTQQFHHQQRPQNRSIEDGDYVPGTWDNPFLGEESGFLTAVALTPVATPQCHTAYGIRSPRSANISPRLSSRGTGVIQDIAPPELWNWGQADRVEGVQEQRARDIDKKLVQKYSWDVDRIVGSSQGRNRPSREANNGVNGNNNNLGLDPSTEAVAQRLEKMAIGTEEDIRLRTAASRHASRHEGRESSSPPKPSSASQPFQNEAISAARRARENYLESRTAETQKYKNQRDLDRERHAERLAQEKDDLKDLVIARAQQNRIAHDNIVKRQEEKAAEALNRDNNDCDDAVKRMKDGEQRNIEHIQERKAEVMFQKLMLKHRNNQVHFAKQYSGQLNNISRQVTKTIHHELKRVQVEQAKLRVQSARGVKRPVVVMNNGSGQPVVMLHGGLDPTNNMKAPSVGDDVTLDMSSLGVLPNQQQGPSNRRPTSAGTKYVIKR